MIQYLLDTPLLAAYLNGRPGALAVVGPMIDADEAATSIVVYAEIAEYLMGFPDYVRRRDELRDIARVVRPYSVTCGTAERYGALRRALRPPSGPGLMGDTDTLIAATALERTLTIITTDTDFDRVSGLAVRRLDISVLRRA